AICQLKQSCAQEREAAVESGVAGGERDAEEAFGGWTVGGAVDNDEAVLFEEEAADVVGGEAEAGQIALKVAEVCHDKQAAVGNEGLDAGDALERADHLVAAGLLLGGHLMDRVLARFERANGGVLDEGGGAAAELLG